eukprot:m.148713 g.148713  ORF g.148713 m.148713 type:complete len:1187 (+) comp23214_c0_seq2:430-3990(+)
MSRRSRDEEIDAAADFNDTTLLLANDRLVDSYPSYIVEAEEAPTDAAPRCKRITIILARSALTKPHGMMMGRYSGPGDNGASFGGSSLADQESDRSVTFWGCCPAGVESGHTWNKVYTVAPNSAAALAGVKVCDEIITVNGQNIVHADKAAVKSALDRARDGGLETELVVERPDFLNDDKLWDVSPKIHRHALAREVELAVRGRNPERLAALLAAPLRKGSSTEGWTTLSCCSGCFGFVFFIVALGLGLHLTQSQWGYGTLLNGYSDGPTCFELARTCNFLHRQEQPQGPAVDDDGVYCGEWNSWGCFVNATIQNAAPICDCEFSSWPNCSLVGLSAGNFTYGGYAWCGGECVKGPPSVCRQESIAFFFFGAVTFILIAIFLTTVCRLVAVSGTSEYRRPTVSEAHKATALELLLRGAIAEHGPYAECSVLEFAAEANDVAINAALEHAGLRCELWQCGDLSRRLNLPICLILCLESCCTPVNSHDDEVDPRVDLCPRMWQYNLHNHHSCHPRFRKMSPAKQRGVLQYRIKTAVEQRDPERLRQLLKTRVVNTDGIVIEGDNKARQLTRLLKSDPHAEMGQPCYPVLKLVAEAADPEIIEVLEAAGVKIKLAVVPVDGLQTLSGGAQFVRFLFSEVRDATDGFTSHKLGPSSSGDVFRGRFAKIGLDLAVKVFRDGATEGSDTAFVEEAKAMAACSHPNILRIVGVSAGGEGGPHFRCILTELMSGGSLRQRLFPSESDHLGLSQRLVVLVGAGRGLAFLHDKLNRVHRDVKPSNILLDRDATTGVVADLGLVRDGRVSGATAITSHAVGTDGFMSPEAANQKITPKMDVFAFGVTLLEAITGRKGEGEASGDALIFDHDLEDSLDELVVLEPPAQNSSRIFSFVDPLIQLSLDRLTTASVEPIFRIAHHCLKLKYRNRPCMSDVVLRLERVLSRVRQPADRLLQARTVLEAVVDAVRPVAEARFAAEHKRIVDKLPVPAIVTADYLPPDPKCIKRDHSPSTHQSECDKCKSRVLCEALDPYAREFEQLHISWEGVPQDAKAVASNNQLRKTAVQWKNSDARKWNVHGSHVEMAKLFAPKGCRQKGAFAELDASAVFNMMSWCALFPPNITAGAAQAAAQARNRVQHADSGLGAEDLAEVGRGLRQLIEAVDAANMLVTKSDRARVHRARMQLDFLEDTHRRHQSE